MHQVDPGFLDIHVKGVQIYSQLIPNDLLFFLVYSEFSPHGVKTFSRLASRKFLPVYRQDLWLSKNKALAARDVQMKFSSAMGVIFFINDN